MKTVQIVDPDLEFGEVQISINIKLIDFVQNVLTVMAKKKITSEVLASSICFDANTLREVLYSPELNGKLMRHAFDLFKLIEEIARALGVTEGFLIPEATARKLKSKGPTIIHLPTRVVGQ